jgi:hypothetical protein
MSIERKIRKKMVSFKQEYKEEWEYLQTHGNASRLVCELVRDYMCSIGLKEADKRKDSVVFEYRNLKAEIDPSILKIQKDIINEKLNGTISETQPPKYDDEIVDIAKDFLD